MSEPNVNKDDIENESGATSRYLQIDILKAIMIILVIFDNTVSWTIKNTLAVSFWERICIPVLLVILGFNMGLSFRREGADSLKELYSWKYFKKKFWRYLFPFLLLYLVSTLVGLIIYGFNIVQLFDKQYFAFDWELSHLFIGIMPMWGPGNWFLPVLFGSVLVMPLLYKGMTKQPIITLVVCFLVELFLHIFIFVFIGGPPFPTWEAYYAWHEIYMFFATCILFYLPGIGLGMYFSFDHDIKSKRNAFMWILAPISIFYIVIHQFFPEYRIWFLRGDFHLLMAPYAALIFLIGMRFLPKKSENVILKGIAVIGKASYHILLTEIFYLAIVISIYDNHYCASIIGITLTRNDLCILYWIVDVVIIVPLGILWYFAEKRIRDLRLARKAG